MPAREQQNSEDWKPKKLRFRRRDFARYTRHFDYIGRLPFHPDCHFRGILWLDHCIYGRVQSDAAPLPPAADGEWYSFDFNPERHTLIHCKPTSDRFSDVPDRSDLYLLYRSTATQIAVAGKRQAATITKGKQSQNFFDRLIKWEQSHPYRRQRLEARYPTLASWQIQERYAESALRGLGLRWPGRPHERRRDWPKCLEEIGLKVEFYERELCWQLRDPAVTEEEDVNR